MKLFRLIRDEDVSGVSGVGEIAVGVVFPSGRCVIEWREPYRSISIYKNILDVKEVHGHGGKTRIEFDERTSDPLDEERWRKLWQGDWAGGE